MSQCLSPSLVAQELSESSSAVLQVDPSIVLKLPLHQGLLLPPGMDSLLPNLELLGSLTSVASLEVESDLPVCVLLLDFVFGSDFVALLSIIHGELADLLVHIPNIAGDLVLPAFEVELVLDVGVGVPYLDGSLLQVEVHSVKDLPPVPFDEKHLVGVLAPSVVEFPHLPLLEGFNDVICASLVSAVLLVSAVESEVEVKGLPKVPVSHPLDHELGLGLLSCPHVADVFPPADCNGQLAVKQLPECLVDHLSLGCSDRLSVDPKRLFFDQCFGLHGLARHLELLHHPHLLLGHLSVGFLFPAVEIGGHHLDVGLDDSVPNLGIHDIVAVPSPVVPLDEEAVQSLAKHVPNDVSSSCLICDLDCMTSFSDKCLCICDRYVHIIVNGHVQQLEFAGFSVLA